MYLCVVYVVYFIENDPLHITNHLRPIVQHRPATHNTVQCVLCVCVCSIPIVSAYAVCTVCLCVECLYAVVSARVCVCVCE